MPGCTQDTAFGPGSTCRDLDFTLKFEQIILSFAADIVFLILCATRLVYLSRQASKLESPGWFHLCLKILMIVMTIVFNATSLPFLLRARNDGVMSLWVAGPAIQLVSAIPLGVLVVIEHFRSVTPSSVVVSYTLIKTIFTSTTLRTYAKIDLFTNARNAAIFSTLTTASYGILFYVEILEKRRLLRQKNLPKESTSSFLTRSAYIWLLPFLWRGRTKVLTVDDCNAIPEEFGACASGSRLQEALEKTPKGSFFLLRASFRAFGPSFLSPVIPRIILLLSTFAQPLLVTQMISFVSDSNRSAEEGWALVGGFVCVYGIMALATSLYWEKVFDLTVLYRGALVRNIYTKSLRLSSYRARSLGSGVASTYMSVDVERICQGTEFFHEMWASFLSVILAVIVVYSQATWPAFLPLVVTTLLITAASRISKHLGAQQSAWLAATDRRVKFLSSIINKFLPIKWANYEDILAQRVAELRAKEMKEANTFFVYFTVVASLSLTSGSLCTLAVLGPYAAIAGHHGHGPLDVNHVFTIVTAVNLLNFPLNMLGQYLPILVASYASLKRIESFLLLDEKSDDEDEELEDDSDKDPSLNEKAMQTLKPDDHFTPIIMSSASFSWDPEADAFLKDVTVEFNTSQLHICAGSVASGKSLLLLSILGETVLRGGRYARPPIRFAYASQDALIVTGTIRDNILFGTEFDERRYLKVLEACALTSEVQKFRAGDQTMLGEKGSRLSGGQRQRVTLARAVYANAPWTLLDDPLSALDAHTETRVFSSLFGPNGLLQGRAVILVTHNVKHLRSAGHILVMEEGRLRHNGTLQEIVDAGYDLKVIETSHSGDENSKAVDQTFEDKSAEEKSSTEESVISKTSLGFRPYIFYAQMATWKQAVMGLLLVALTGVMKLGLQVYLKEWSTTNDAHADAWIGGYAGFNFVWVVTNIIAIWQFTCIMANTTGKTVHSAEVKSLFAALPTYFMSTPAGTIINRLSQDVFLMDYEFTLALINWTLQLVTLLGMLVFIFVATPWLTLSVIPLGLLYYGTLVFYTATSTQLQHLQIASKSPLYTLFSSTMTGLETIRAYGAEVYFWKQNDMYLDRSQKPFYLRFAGMRFLRTVLSLISFVVAVGLAILSVALRHSTDPSLLGLGLSNLTNLALQLSLLLMTFANLENGSVAVSRIHEVVSLPPEDTSTSTKVSLSVPTNWPSTGEIKFENVQLQYKPDLSPVLHDISFHVKAGQRVGICGQSGSGKSSLILALFHGLQTPLISGKITIDGLEDAFLWHASLRDNLDPERQLSDVDIWSALEHVGMKDAVTTLPDKLDTVIEDGGSLSKGQKQLLCLARVLLHKRKIVVLDEASSSLDVKTDEKMHEVINTELAGCTILAVAHRIATIIDYDWILVMHEGIIVESGTPQELLGLPASKFAALASNQGLISTSQV
ncbi:unnamed protein product [Somion occarium]|uniref:P-loop containing nucleoside triphosphate hydrolase protein n=1 Tax=Somion occarium TaxID=3059160 RepID=A0ABP1D6C2_9APHY